MSNETIKKPDNTSAKSEEVQHIIERMPTYWAKWVVLCIMTLMGIVLLLGFIIQYPEAGVAKYLPRNSGRQGYGNCGR